MPLSKWVTFKNVQFRTEVRSNDVYLRFLTRFGSFVIQLEDKETGLEFWQMIREMTHYAKKVKNMTPEEVKDYLSKVRTPLKRFIRLPKMPDNYTKDGDKDDDIIQW